MFANTNRFRTAVSLVNRLDNKPLKRILTRIILHTTTPSDHALTTHSSSSSSTSSSSSSSSSSAGARRDGDEVLTMDEKEQLMSIYNMEANEVDMIIDGSSYIFDQTAYLHLSAAKLFARLTEAGMGQPQSEVFALVWRESKDAVTNHLRERSFGAPLTLDSISWKLKLGLCDSKHSSSASLSPSSSSSSSSAVVSRALLDLGLSSPFPYDTDTCTDAANNEREKAREDAVYRIHTHGDGKGASDSNNPSSSSNSSNHDKKSSNGNGNGDGYGGNHASKTQHNTQHNAEHLVLDLDQRQVQDLFNSLETIQLQLDELMNN